MKNMKFKINLILLFILAYTTVFAQYHEISWSKGGIKYTAFALENSDDNVHIRLNFMQNGENNIVKYDCKINRDNDKDEWIVENAIYILPENHKNYRASNIIFNKKGSHIKHPIIIDKLDRGRKDYIKYSVESSSWKKLKTKKLTVSYLQKFFRNDDPYYARLLMLDPLYSYDKQALREISILTLLETIHYFDDYKIFKDKKSNILFLEKMIGDRIKHMSLTENTDIIVKYLSKHYILPDSRVTKMLYDSYKIKIKCASMRELIGAVNIVKSSRFASLRMKYKDFLYEEFDLFIDSNLPSASQEELAGLLKQDCIEENVKNKIKVIYLAKRTSDLVDIKKILKELEKRDIEKSKIFTDGLVDDLKNVFKDQVKLYVDEEEESIGGKAIPFVAEYLGLADNYYWQNWKKHFGPLLLKDGIDKYNSAQVADKRDYQRRLNSNFPSYRIHLPNMAFPINDFNKGIENDVKNSFKSPDLNMLDMIKAIWANKKDVLASTAIEGGIYQVAKMLAVDNPYVMPVYITRDILVMFKVFKDACEEKEMEIYDKTIISYSVEISSAYSNFIALAAKMNTDYYSNIYKSYERAYDANNGLKKRVATFKEGIPDNRGLLKLELYR